MIANPEKQQIPPLRCAPVGMTNLCRHFRNRTLLQRRSYFRDRTLPSRRRTLVEEDGDVVGGELLVGLPAGTGSDCSGFVSGLVEILENGVGELGDVGAVPLDDKLGSAGLPLGHGAGLAGVLIRWRGWEALGLKELCDLMLDRLGGEGGDVAAEVLHGEQEAMIFGDGDADDIQFGVEEVGTMDGGGHPDVVEVGGSLSVCGDVFRDGAEAGAGVASASDEVGFAGILGAKLD